jgi:hypothetical protein
VGAGIVTETRTKVYRSLQEQQRDEAEAASYGWHVVTRDSAPEGYRVSYQLGSEWADPAPATSPRRGLRRSTLLVILWTAGMVLLWLLLVPRAHGAVDGRFDGDLATMSQTTLTLGLLGIWFVGFCITSLIWFMSRPRAR